KLVQDRPDRTAIGNLPLDAFRHQFQGVLDVLLEIAIRRAARHRADRTHAAISLERAALVQKYFAGRLFRAGEQRADHHAFGPGGDGLGEIAVSCGTPTPATMRVVQIEPGPMPTLIPSAPASISALAPSAVAILPAITAT